jgi:hypothetical protein
MERSTRRCLVQEVVNEMGPVRGAGMGGEGLKLVSMLRRTHWEVEGGNWGLRRGVRVACED